MAARTKAWRAKNKELKSNLDKATSSMYFIGLKLNAANLALALVREGNDFERMERGVDRVASRERELAAQTSLKKDLEERIKAHGELLEIPKPNKSERAKNLREKEDELMEKRENHREKVRFYSKKINSLRVQLSKIKKD